MKGRVGYGNSGQRESIDRRRQAERDAAPREGCAGIPLVFVNQLPRRIPGGSSWGTPLRRAPSLRAGNVCRMGYTELQEAGDQTRCVADARSARALGSLGRLGREAFSDLSFGDGVGPPAARLPIPLGRLIPMPTSPPTSASHSKLTENVMATNPIPAHETRRRQQAEETAKLASLPVVHEHAAGIDVGDRTATCSS